MTATLSGFGASTSWRPSEVTRILSTWPKSVLALLVVAAELFPVPAPHPPCQACSHLLRPTDSSLAALVRANRSVVPALVAWESAGVKSRASTMRTTPILWRAARTGQKLQQSGAVPWTAQSWWYQVLQHIRISLAS